MKTAIVFKLSTALIVLFHCAASATGALVPNNPHIQRPPHNGIFSVKSQHVNVNIDDQIASTAIEQVFTNNTNSVLEATYLFPIPEDVTISRFSMWMNGEEIQGQVVEAGKARRVYEGIVRRTRDPGLLEYVGRNLFQARVYPVPALGDVRIRIVYDELLDYESGLVSYTYPLKADRFQFGNIGELGLAVKIVSDVPIRSLYSPTHDIDRKIGNGEAFCGFEKTDVNPISDFRLYYTVSESDVAMNLITHRGDENHGYFLLLASAGDMVNKNRVIPKDMVFVIDRSGSMKGPKIEQAKKALAYCVERLNDEDRFNIVAFSTGIETFENGLVSADSKNKKSAKEFIAKFEARGGTDINGALLKALEIPPSKRPQMIVFLTDGLPTVGVTSVESILSNLEVANSRTIRLFPFGLGYDVNTNLLDQIADDFRALAQYVAPGESVDEAVSGFYDKVSYPVLSDISLSFSDIDVLDVYPRELSDLFYGTQMVVVGRYHDGGETQVMLEGNVRNNRQTRHYDAEFTESKDDAPFIARLWANRKIAWIQSEMKINGRSFELEDEIRALAMEHGIITPYTSYLVLEPGSEHLLAAGTPTPPATSFSGPSTPTIRVSETARPIPMTSASVTRGVEMPMDVVMDAVALKGGAVKQGSSTQTRGGRGSATQIQIDGVSVNDPLGSGKKAEFKKSRHISRSKEDEIARLPTEEKFRYVEGTTFVRTVDGWADLAFKDGKDVIEIEYLSEEYFELLKKHPKIKKYLALGHHVEFVVEEKMYRVKPAPEKETDP